MPNPAPVPIGRALPPPAQGRLGGRKPQLSADGLDTARRLMADPLLTMEEIASRLGVGRTTLYRSLGRARATPIGGIAMAAKATSTARAPGREPRVAAAPLLAVEARRADLPRAAPALSRVLARVEPPGLVVCTGSAASGATPISRSIWL